MFKIVTIIIVIIVVGGLGYWIYQSTLTSEKECVNDEECVPATCCHPSECVSISKAPNCENIGCTDDCRSGTMDCGCGHCVCINNQCQVDWEKEAGEWCY